MRVINTIRAANIQPSVNIKYLDGVLKGDSTMSAFSRHFVAAIKANGKILRETTPDGSPVVHIPFLSEYSILLKNLSTQRAVVKVSIDGTDVLDGKSIVVNSNQNFELERFVKDLGAGARFKFIEKTAQISDFRGDFVDDGVVRIEYRFEKKPEPIDTVNWWNWSYSGNLYDGGVNNRLYTNNVVGGDRGVLRSMGNITCGSTVQANYAASALGAPLVQREVVDKSISPSEDGITVAGSQSTQKFTRTTVNELETEVHVIALFLRGKVGEAIVAEPITVKTKTQCKVCGTVHKGVPNFCSNCSAAL